MRTSIPFSVANAFSDGQQPFSGNPAGVVCGADDLSPETMQRIARQLNLVETTFVSQSDVADFKFRYFTPRKELPITGHPTVAALWVLKSSIQLANRPDVTIETAGGTIDAIVEQETVWITQGAPVFRAMTDSPEAIATALGLGIEDLIASPAAMVVDAGLGHLVVEVTAPALQKARMELSLLQELCAKNAASEAQIFSRDEDGTVRTRNLCPRPGEEDPACGNGNAALGAFLSRHSLLHEGQTLVARQGDVVNRSSRILIRRLPDRNDLPDVIIGGSARIMVEGAIRL